MGVYYYFIPFFPFWWQMNVEKLMKMAGAVRTGGKGSVRRCVSIYPSDLTLFLCNHLEMKHSMNTEFYIYMCVCYLRLHLKAAKHIFGCAGVIVCVREPYNFLNLLSLHFWIC